MRQATATASRATCYKCKRSLPFGIASFMAACRFLDPQLRDAWARKRGWDYVARCADCDQIHCGNCRCRCPV